MRRSQHDLSVLGKTRVSMISVASSRTSTSERWKSPELVVKEEKGTVVRLAEIADVSGAGAENYEDDVRFNGQSCHVMGIGVLPTATRST